MTQVSLPQVTQTTVKLVEEIRDVNASLSRSWLVSNSHWRVYPLPLSPHGKLPFFPLPLPLSHCSCHRQAMTGAWGDPLLWSSICSRSNDNGYAACLRLRICIWSAANKACKERSSPWENIDQWKVWRGSTYIKHIIKPYRQTSTSRGRSCMKGSPRNMNHLLTCSLNLCNRFSVLIEVTCISMCTVHTHTYTHINITRITNTLAHSNMCRWK